VWSYWIPAPCGGGLREQRKGRWRNRSAVFAQFVSAPKEQRGALTRRKAGKRSGLILETGRRDGPMPLIFLSVQAGSEGALTQERPGERGKKPYHRKAKNTARKEKKRLGIP